MRRAPTSPCAPSRCRRTLACSVACLALASLVGCGGDGATEPTATPPDDLSGGVWPRPGSTVLVKWERELGGNGHYYELSLNYSNEAIRVLTWTAARDAAALRQLGVVRGHLATVSSGLENTFIVENVLPEVRTPAALIGGFQPAGTEEPAGGWRWVTDEPFTYTNWAPLEPNEALPDADYLVYTAEPAPLGTWNDVINLESIYVVEYDCGRAPNCMEPDQ